MMMMMMMMTLVTNDAIMSQESLATHVATCLAFRYSRESMLDDP